MEKMSSQLPADPELREAYSRLCEALATIDDKSVDGRLTVSVTRKSATQKTVKPSKLKVSFDPVRVAAFESRFAAAPSRQVASSVIVDLKADKSASPVDITEIARRLIHVAESYKSKAHAVKAIEKWIARKFDTERKLKDAGDIF